MDRPVLLCGLGRVGGRVLESLQALGATVTVVDWHASSADPKLAGVTVVTGDCKNADVLERAGVRTAGAVVVVTSDDLCNVSTAMLVRRMNPTCRIAVRMFNQNLIPRLGAAVKNVVGLSVSALTAPLMALTAVSGDSLAAFDVSGVPQQLLELTVAADSPHLGERVSAVAAQRNLMVVSHRPVGTSPRLLSDVDGNAVLAVGDRLVVCGQPAAVERLTHPEQPVAVQWASGVRRILRTVRHTVAAIDLPLKVVATTLLLVLAGSTLVFRHGVGTTWFDGFYQTVSIMATGSDLHGEDKPDWVRGFLGGLKLAGAVLLAGFTAVFTNYLIRAKLGGVLESRKIPDGGHVLVCGLGNVGFRCVQELLRLGHQVVAIDKDAGTPFADTVRRMGAAVIVGDATVPEVLKQARAGTARAVLAVASNELANLEIALLVRELNPEQRVVVRLTDPDFAQAARESANLRYAVSPPQLAAPVFAAAVFGDRVLSLARVGPHTVAVVELVIEPDEVAVLDKTIHELMVDYRFLPLGVSGQPPFADAGIATGYRLKEGDRLTVAMDLADLPRLVRREEPPKEWAVFVDEVPLTAGGELLPLVRTCSGCTQEEAEERVKSVPFQLAGALSRGQAEELAARLNRERVRSRVVNDAPPTA